MVKRFEELSGHTYPKLNAIVEEIHQVVKNEVDTRRQHRQLAFTLPYSAITREMVDMVGGKNANLGEMCSRLKVPIPRGFAITTAAFEALMEENDLLATIQKQKLAVDATDPQSLQETSQAIQAFFLNARVPLAVETAILSAYQQLTDQAGPKVRVAMRSSAIGEDSELSFAGQYLSVLNVLPQQLLEAYRRVLASLFSARAIAYRYQKGIPAENIAMSVACLEMVPAETAGVLYTRHPFDPTTEHIIINAVWGLGPYAVDGVIAPDVFTLTREPFPQLVSARVATKSVRLVANEAGEVCQRAVDAHQQAQACLSPAQAMELASIGMRLESHFQRPQDIEWALTPEKKWVLLQTRPLKIECTETPSPADRQPPIAGSQILLEAGDTAFPGVGAGPVHSVRTESDLLDFPAGAVLISPRSSPTYVMVMARAQAIVTDAGGVTGHMASLAREFRVPTIVNAKEALQRLAPGRVVTVDATTGRIYDGRVEPLLARQGKKEAFMTDTPVYRSLRTIAERIVPLNLVDPKSTRFSPQGCGTIHDVMRLIHELSYQEMFHINDLATDQGRVSKRLLAPIPLDLHLIDLGGGISAQASGRATVYVEQITSVPFAALLRGMLDEKLRSREPKPVDLQGFFSVMSRQMLSPPNGEGERFGDKSYAIVSDKYLNFSSRVGYHYSVLDVYCGHTISKNYINFQFKGGAADDVRRNRRARLIQRILSSLDFSVEVQGDRAAARFGKAECPQIQQRLELLGRILQFTRQMDMLMQNEASVSILADCFLKGDYGLKTAGLSNSAA
jgi:pyruvate,water dikinase